MPATTRVSRRSTLLRSLTFGMALAIVAVGAPFGPARTDAATGVIAGFRDFVYGDAPGGDDVTAGTVQSKLWYHDGRWFGILFDPSSTTNAKYRIWRFDMATQNWTSTVTPVDDRNRSHADVVSTADGTIYVASARAEDVVEPIDTTRNLRIYKYTYVPATQSYAIVAGFPKLVPSTGAGTGYSTIAVDSTGRVWVVFTQANRIRISSSGDDGVTWSTPIDIPGQGNNVLGEDIAAIAPMSGAGTDGVGVLWSNQSATDRAFYFAAHVDGQPVGTWGAREIALGDPVTPDYSADNHISLKTDASGNLIAAVKTAYDDDPAPDNAGDPLIDVLKRTGSPAVAGTWAEHPVTTVAIEGTRPVLVLDDAADEANVFITDPTLASPTTDQAIYRRTAPLSSLDFGTPSIGTAFIDSATEKAINDATSMKQMTTAASGILVEATNIPTFTYLHGCAGDPCPDAPVANFTGTPTSGPAPLTVQFTDTSTDSPTGWLWDFGDGGTSTVQNPSHTYSDPGTYTVSLTATNPAGNDSVTKTDYISVDPPAESTYRAITPFRIVDTRSGLGIPDSLVSGTPATFDVDGQGGAGGVPADATAVTGNLTVVGQTAAGFVTLSPDADATPGTSTINFPTSDVRANGITIPLNADGSLSAVYKATAGKKTDIAIDITGYFTEGTSESTFKSITPVRVLDSRTPTGVPGVFQANVHQTFDVAGQGGADGVGADAVAVTGNLTVVGQTAAGFLSIGPDATDNPTTSTLNFPLGDVRANNVTVDLDDDGALSAVYKAAAGKTAHVIFDVTGYFVDDTSGATFVPVPPARIIDTRTPLGFNSKLTHGVPETMSTLGHDGVAEDAVAIVGNLTVVSQTKAGFVAVTPDPIAVPTSSTINFPFGDIRANGFTTDLADASDPGDVSATYRATSGATTHVIVDVMGYYR
jgi:PKD repeat protein